MRTFAYLSLLLAPIACHALATKLLTPAERRTAVPLTTIADFNKIPFPIRTPHFVLSHTDHFQLHGKDKSGLPWSLQLPDASRGAYRSGSNYYFHGYTGGAGFAPATWILVLTFDEIGRPVPFHFYTQGSMADLVNLDGRGPQLLQQDYWGSFFEDPGLFVTTLYEQRGPYWYRSDGPHGTRVFPAFEEWSVTWRGRPATLVQNPATKYTVRDNSNDPARGVPLPALKHTRHGLFQPGPGTVCQTIKPYVSVIDSPRGRQISLETLDLAALQNPLTRHTATGLHQWPGSTDCTVSVLWSQIEKIN